MWMVLDGSKEASLPSCRVKPSLALQHRVTHSISISGGFGVRLVIFSFVNLKEEFNAPLTRLFGSMNQMNQPPLLVCLFWLLHSVTLQLLLDSVSGP